MATLADIFYTDYYSVCSEFLRDIRPYRTRQTILEEAKEHPGFLLCAVTLASFNQSKAAYRRMHRQAWEVVKTMVADMVIVPKTPSNSLLHGLLFLAEYLPSIDHDSGNQTMSSAMQKFFSLEQATQSRNALWLQLIRASLMVRTSEDRIETSQETQRLLQCTFRLLLRAN